MKPFAGKSSLGICLLIAVATLASLLVRGVVRVTDYEIWEDPVTGSFQVQRIWFSCLRSRRVDDLTDLGRWCREHGEGLPASRMVLIRGSSAPPVGRPPITPFGALPIHKLHPVFNNRGNIMTDFVETSTDAEIRSFLKCMKSGTLAEQESAVAALRERARGRTGAGPG